MSIKTKTIRFFTKNKFTSIAIVFLFFVTLWSISSLLQNNSLFSGKSSLAAPALGTVQSINGVDLTPGVSQSISLPKGSLNISSTGLYTFNSLNDEIGVSSFPYVIKDSSNVTATANITIDITDPCTLTQNGTTASACGVIYTQTTVTISVPSLTNNPKPSINGTCVIGNILSITITPTNETINGLTCAISGTYSINPITNIPDGNYCAIVRAQDPEITINTANDQECGVVDTSTSVSIVVPPLTNNPKPTLTGSCETGAALIITITTGANNVSNQALPSFTCDATGTYSTNPPTNIPDGPYCSTVVATDAAGNVANDQECGTIDTSTFITVDVPPTTNNPKPPITGTCESGGIITITITVGTTNTLNQTIPSFTCDGTGTYTVNPPSDIPNGPFCGNATIIDTAGNTATATPKCGTIDTSTFVTIVVPALGTNNLPSFTGTCETGASLNLTITPTNERINGVTCVNETYSIPATVYIPTGNYCGSIVATDATGNTATASGCGDILVTVEVPITTEDTTPTISGSCTPSTAGGYQVPVEVTLRFGTGSDTGAGTLSEIINTTCSTQGTYTVTPTKDIPVGLYSATAKATSEIGNIAISTNSGTITTPQPENFSVITDPYQCGKSIIGKATSNYGINQITVNLFSKKTDNSGNYETTPKYTFNPVPDSNGNYEIKPDYTNEANFKQGEYKVEFSLKSNTSITKTDSYIANITDKCNPLALVTTTIRTGGLNTLVFAIIPILLALAYYRWDRVKGTK